MSQVAPLPLVYIALIGDYLWNDEPMLGDDMGLFAATAWAFDITWIVAGGLGLAAAGLAVRLVRRGPRP